VAKFNRPGRWAAVTSAIKSERKASGRTYEGAPGYARDDKSELFLLAVTNMVGEDTFYEKAGDRDDRFTELVRQVAVLDPAWLFQLLRWLRAEGNMRSAPIVGACEAVAEWRTPQFPEGSSESRALNRSLIDVVCQRADEPGELLAYWTSRYGRSIPKPVKRGLADAVSRLYNERSLLKYDTAATGFRFGDVIELVHPSPDPAKPWQGALFAHALDRRHGRNTEIPEQLATLRARAALMALPVDQRRAALAEPDRLAAAGITWEALAGWLQGPMDAAAWEAVIPSMGFMALLRNLRNFDQAGVSDEVAERIAARFTDPDQVARSRQFPFRFLAAYKAAQSLRWSWPLEKALTHSLANVPALSGRTLILVDRSGSMFGAVSSRSGLNRADSAAVFGAALAVRAASADLIEFGTGHQPVSFHAGESLLTIVKRFGRLGGTNTAAAVRDNYAGQDRVIIVTDEQTWGGNQGAKPTKHIPDHIPVYTWNLAGYKHGHGPSGNGHRHTFGGLTDAAFRLIPLLESGHDTGWPWEA
jgi:TROVE domain-containing protein